MIKTISQMKISFKLNQQGVAVPALVLVVLLIGLGVGVYLVQKTQIFKPKASVNPITFKSSIGEALPVNVSGVPQSTSSAVKVEIISPLGGPQASSGAQAR